MRPILPALLGLGLFLCQFAGGVQAGGKAKDADVEELKKLFGANKVSIVLNYNSTTVKGRIDRGMNLFGKKFIVLVTDTGRPALVSVTAIAAIKQEP